MTIRDAATCSMGDETLCPHGVRAGRYCSACDVGEKVPITPPSNTVRPQSSWVRVSTLSGEPLADVDMSSGERLSVQWPCRIDFISIGAG